MSKIVQAVNAMISNKHLISNVAQGARELFFLYKSQYKWSMWRRDDGEYFLWYYPGKEDLSELTTYGDDDWEETKVVIYKTEDIRTKEARASFAELYGVLKERLYGMDTVLDDIISEKNIL